MRSLDFDPVDIIIIDYDSLFHRTGEPYYGRVRTLKALSEHFDVKVWRRPRFISFRFGFRGERRLMAMYEMDFAELLSLPSTMLKWYMVAHRTLLVSARHELLEVFGWRLVYLEDWGFLSVTEKFYRGYARFYCEKKKTKFD